MTTLDPALASEQYGYLTTTGRTSGEPREIEIWFALEGSVVYLMSGGRDQSHWVRNLLAESQVSMRIGETTFTAVARVVEAETEEDALVRPLLLAKYAPGHEGDLSEWGRRSLPVAIEMELFG